MKIKNTLKSILLFSNLTLCLSLFADQTVTQGYKFKNSEVPTGTAKDFHVKFSPPPISPPPIAWSPGGAFPNAVIGGNGIDFYGNGAGIASGSAFSLTATFAGRNPGHVLEYWWTKDGSSANMNNLTNILGNKHGQQKRGKFDFAMIPSTGNGTIAITVLSDLHVFQIPPNVTGDITAQQFAAFIMAIPFGVVESDLANIPTIPNEVTIYFTTFDGTDPNFTVNINQDITQQTTFTYLDTADIPTLSQWGLIILSLLVIASGILFIRKRKVSLVLAGGEEVYAGQQGWFLTRPFFVISASLIGFAVLLFASNAVVTGSVSVKDFTGTLISCIIIGYILHLLEIFKKSE
jgi:hypothetical protein